MNRVMLAVLVVPLLLLITADALIAQGSVTLASGLAAIVNAAVAVRVARAEPPSARLLIPIALVSSEITTVMVGREVEGVWPLAVSWSLIVLAGASASRIRTAVDLLLTGLIALAVVTAPWVCAPSLPQDSFRIALMLALATAVITAVGIGLLVRSNRLRARETRQAVLAMERRDMARELHDVIAHEVTGMVVLAQAAASLTAETTTRQVLERIESSGLRALGEIRAMVSTLRADPGVEPLPPQATDLAALRGLVDEFTRSSSAEVQAHLDDIDLPVPVAIAAHRILGEALTNVRRHAGDARTVQISVTADSTTLMLRVTDDGTGDAGIGGGSGYGLLGVGERAAALGGTTQAGRDENGQWTVLATLPRATPE
ncbi:histidine kinase [Nocardia sp. NPDC006630]|uniref:sensor histidine kinase n=1 Tax=Nocardia sp. NPDC006630 TaxID=3157181 RepID=UPI0033B88BC7